MEITSYDQLSNDEIIVHTIYKEFYYPLVKEHAQESKNIINEAILLHCKKYNIEIEHIFDINVLGNLIPKKLKHGCLNVDNIVNSRSGTLTEWHIKDNIKEIRTKLNKNKFKEEYISEWIK